MMERIGYDRMGEKLWTGSDEARGSLLLMAALILAKELPNTSLKEVSNITAHDARRVADIYEKRIDNDFAVSGQAYGSDELMPSSLQLCKKLAEKTNPIVRKMQ